MSIRSIIGVVTQLQKARYGFCLLVLMSTLLAAHDSVGAELTGIRVYQAGDKVRAVFDLTKPAVSDVFILKSPDRLVVDLHNTSKAFILASAENQSDYVQKIRLSSPPKRNTLRVVFELTKTLSAKQFRLKRQGKYGDRVVVDLEPNHRVPPKKSTPKKPKKAPVEAVVSPDVSKKTSSPKTQQPKPKPTSGAVIAQSETRSTASRDIALRDIIVVIDPGHGGKDPGAVGKKGVREKDVNLKVAQRLASVINQKRGYKAYLTRQDDRFIPLQKRTEIARSRKADLFISIHADGFHDSRARGASVWVLSTKGAFSETGRWLETHQLAPDLLGESDSLPLHDKDPLLAEVLLDLSMTHTIATSSLVADHIVRAMTGVAHMHKKVVQRAAFKVLKSPDIPSVLVETAFISNPKEEKLLTTYRHQLRLAKAIFVGVQNYFRANPLPDTWVAAPTHRVKSGETLSEIARDYQVNIVALKRANQLSNDQIRVGQMLKIPDA